ncbi:MAG: type II secretion system protein [Myxococcota bacterium]
MPTSPEPRRRGACGARSWAAQLRDAAGATLIELVISIVIVAIAVTGTLLSINRTVRSSADPMIVKQALAVAEAYLEEVLLRDYYDPDLGAVGGICPLAEASRDLYDNICDYDLLDDSGARDQDGNAIAGLGSYRVRISVDAAGAALGGLAGSAQVVRVDVRVTNVGVVDITLSGYRTNY